MVVVLLVSVLNNAFLIFILKVPSKKTNPLRTILVIGPESVPHLCHVRFGVCLNTSSPFVQPELSQMGLEAPRLKLQRHNQGGPQSGNQEAVSLRFPLNTTS